MNWTPKEARYLAVDLERGQAARVAAIVTIMNVVTVCVAFGILHFMFFGERAHAESGDDNTAYCVMVANGAHVVEDYEGQTEKLCGGSVEKKTKLETFNSIVWAVTPFMRPATDEVTR
jgi:hypothetical protein